MRDKFIAFRPTVGDNYMLIRHFETLADVTSFLEQRCDRVQWIIYEVARKHYTTKVTVTFDE